MPLHLIAVVRLVATRVSTRSLSIMVIVAAAVGCAATHSTAGLDAQIPVPSGIEIVRFTAQLTGHVPPRDSDGHYRPAGYALPDMGSDPRLDPGHPARYQTVIESNSDGKGGFTDQGSVQFAQGRLEFRGVYPTHNEPTVVPGLMQTVMVEKIMGGDGKFQDATGYFLLNSTLSKSDFNGSLNGIVFLNTRVRSTGGMH